MPSMLLSLSVIGTLAASPEELGRVRQLAEETLALSREAGSGFGVAASLYWLGIVAQALGKPDSAEAFFEQSLAAAREVGDRWAAAHPTARLGDLALRRGDYPRATAFYQEALIARRDLGDARSIPLCLDGLARVASAQNDPQRAARLLGAEEAMRERVGAIVPPMIQAEYDWAVTRTRDSLSETAFRTLWDEGRAMRMEEAIAYALDQPARD